MSPSPLSLCHFLVAAFLSLFSDSLHFVAPTCFEAAAAAGRAAALRQTHLSSVRRARAWEIIAGTRCLCSGSVAERRTPSAMSFRLRGDGRRCERRRGEGAEKRAADTSAETKSLFPRWSLSLHLCVCVCVRAHVTNTHTHTHIHTHTAAPVVLSLSFRCRRALPVALLPFCALDVPPLLKPSKGDALSTDMAPASARVDCL